MQATLLAKGFRKHDGDHHFFFYFHDNRKTTIRTKVSHGIREYNLNLLKLVRQQMRLVSDELDEYFDCTMSVKKYGELMIARGHVKA
jgi:hypothetical protein